MRSVVIPSKPNDRFPGALPAKDPGCQRYGKTKVVRIPRSASYKMVFDQWPSLVARPVIADAIPRFGMNSRVVTVRRCSEGRIKLSSEHNLKEQMHSLPEWSRCSDLFAQIHFGRFI